jgi:DNA-binding PadR family transcriptional regulator
VITLLARWLHHRQARRRARVLAALQLGVELDGWGLMGATGLSGPGLYAAIDELEDEGLVVGRWDDAPVGRRYWWRLPAEGGRAAVGAARFVVLHTEPDGTASTLSVVVYDNIDDARHRAAERHSTAAEHGWPDRYEVCRLVPVETPEPTS